VDKLRGLTAVALLRVLSWLPFSALQILGTVLGRLFYVSASRSRRTIEANLLYCFPHWSAQQRDAFTRRCLQENAKTTVEMGALWHWSSDKTIALIREVHGQRLLDAALAKKRGVIVLAPHLGNWEMVGFFLAHVAKVTSLYAPAKIPLLDQLIYEGRSRNGAHLVPTNAGGVKALLKALKAGEMVGILPDQVPDESSGVFAPFFGQPALTMTLVTSLMQRTGAEVLCCYAKRRSDRQGFDICLLPPADNLMGAKDEIAAATAMNASVERCVNDCSEQYQWEYKRFREQKDDSLSLYLADRRLQYRRLLKRSMRVTCSEGTGWSGILLNLTPGGFMLLTQQSLVAGAKYTVTLEIPGQEDESVTAEVKCVWSRMNNASGEYRSGMLITFTQQADALRLLLWLEQYEKKRPLKAILTLQWYGSLARLPLTLLNISGDWLGRLHCRLKTRRYQYADDNIRHVFADHTPAQQQQLIESCLQAYGRLMLSRPFVRLASESRVERRLPLICQDANSLAVINRVLNQPQGTILLLPNLGYLELALRYVARRAPLTLFYQPIMGDSQDRTLYRASIRDGYAMSHMHDDYVESALRILSQGGVVAFLPHQLLPSQRPLLAPWFGHSVSIMDLFPLASMTQAEIVCAYGVPDDGGQGYEIRFSDAPGIKTATDAQACAVALSRAMERGVREHPRLYGWVYRMFPKKRLASK